MAPGCWREGGRWGPEIRKGSHIAFHSQRKAGKSPVLYSHRRQRGATTTAILRVQLEARREALYLVVPGDEVLEASKAGIDKAGQDGEQHHQEVEQRGRGLQTWEQMQP